MSRIWASLGITKDTPSSRFQLNYHTGNKNLALKALQLQFMMFIKVLMLQESIIQKYSKMFSWTTLMQAGLTCGTQMVLKLTSSSSLSMLALMVGSTRPPQENTSKVSTILLYRLLRKHQFILGAIRLLVHSCHWTCLLLTPLTTLLHFLLVKIITYSRESMDFG